LTNLAAPNFHEYQHRLTDALVDAITSSAVPHVVFLSSMGAQHPSGTGPITALHRAEAALLSLEKTRLSILRAAYFMENLEASLSMLGQGVLPSFVPAGLAFDMVASVDFGRLAAQLLVERATKNEVVELGGPARSMNDVAAAISGVLGKPVRVQELPTEAMVPTLTVMEAYGSLAGSQDNLRRFVALGGRVALGNDYTDPPQNAFPHFELGMPMWEVRRMAEAGMTAMQVIVAATRNAAHVCGLEDRLGTLEPGKLADVLVVDGDPVRDLGALTQVRLVIHSGVVIRS
jgi:hypothetical protein